MVWPLLVIALSATPAEDLRFVSPLVKVRPDAAASGSTSVQLTAARGECEGIQVVSPREEVPVVTGALAPRIFQVDYVKVEKPSNAEGAAGLWPDPLVPTVEGRGRVFYLEWCVPRAQAPGVYRGTVGKGATWQLTVEPFEIPATSSLPNSFGLSLYSIAKGHQLPPESPEAHALLREYAKRLLQHRVSAHGMSMTPPRLNRGTIDFTAYDREVGPFLDGTVLPSGARFTSVELRDVKSLSSEERTRYSRSVEAHFQERGWNAQLFFYAKDEPKPDEIPLVLTQARAFAGIARVPVLVTSPFDARLKGAAGVLCPNLNCFFPRAGAQTCRNVQSTSQLRSQLPSGTKVWWYQSCSSHGCQDGARDPVYSGWASYMVDASGPQNRAMGVLAYNNGIDGELYFDTVFAYNTGDPWKSVYAFAGNGDGTFFYPGTPDRVGAQVPVESLRLKTLRDGLEDFEYLRLAEACGERALAQRSGAALAQSGYRINPDPQVWQEVRARLTRRITERWTAGECKKGQTVSAE
ncbi:MAG: DUF4091 domain-containing protein [Myxococcaceae bacterium]